MMTIDELKTAVIELSEQDLLEFRSWFDE